MHMDQTQTISPDQTQSLSQRISLKATIDQNEALELTNRNLAEYVQNRVNENGYLEYCLKGKLADTPPWQTSKLDGYGGIASKPRKDRTDNHYEMLQNVAAPEHRTRSLREHLLCQLRDLEVGLKRRGVDSFDCGFAEFLLNEIATGNPDTNPDTSTGIGMLPRSLVELRADYERVCESVTWATAQRTLDQIQQHLTPPGVGAETEIQRVSLLLQRVAQPMGHDELDLEQPLQYVNELQELVDNHLEDLKARRFGFVADTLNVTADYLTGKVMPELHRLLSTRPFDKFHTSNPGIVPEVIVRISESDEIAVKENNRFIPRIRVPKRFLADTNESRELRKCVNSDGRERTSLDEAKRLVETIVWRGSVLKLLAEELTRFQGDFFRYGPEHLTPLTQRDLAKCDDVREQLEPSRFEQLAQIKSEIASANDSLTKQRLTKDLARQEERITKLLESRISRALKDKWIDTPHGIYPMKKCFLDNPAWVERHLRAILLSESKLAPYSDVQLTEELRKHGIDLKSDTVRKYRKKLGFASANKRRVRSPKRSA